MDDLFNLKTSTLINMRANIGIQVIKNPATVNKIYDDIQLTFHKTSKIIKKCILGQKVELRDSLEHIDGLERQIDDLFDSFKEELKAISNRID